jgi:hypothetical protein
MGMRDGRNSGLVSKFLQKFLLQSIKKNNKVLPFGPFFVYYDFTSKTEAMKTSKKTFSVVALLAVTITLLSWNFSVSNKRTSNYASPYEDVYSDPESNLNILTFVENAGGNGYANYVPGAEDVLVKKIPGDNSHLIMMVYYSKENYSAPSVTINSGSTIVFKDDGTGYDEKAGDGLYTARIDADVKAFRRQVVEIAKQMKESGYKPYRYINREFVYDPNVAATFDAQGFDANKAVSIAGVTNGLGSSPNANGPTAQMTKIGQNCIFITNLGVVEDSTRTYNYCTQTGNVNGAWSFGTIMRQLASKSPSQIATDAQLSDFVKNWLNTWLSTQIINGDTVQARSLMNTQILTPWLNKSRGAGNPVGQLDMRFAPFKLTAIANRFDLRAGQKFSSPSEPCGEGRLVYCLINSNCTGILNMTVIFEYTIYKPNTCDSLKSWAQQWFALKDSTLGSSNYNRALQKITDQFTLCGTNPNGVNQSSLAQTRTNEITLSPAPKMWELKEFHLDSASGGLIQTTVAQAPADKYDSEAINSNVQRMVAFVNQNAGGIIKGITVLPAQWQGFGFLGAASHIFQAPTGVPIPPFRPFHWDGTDSTNKPTFIKSDNARSEFSLQTCNGCHAGETQTGFTHVDPVFFGTEATLSGFLSGKAGRGGAIDFDGDSTNGLMSVKDPALRPSAANATIRTFNEINRRAQDLKTFSSTTCASPLGISAQLMFQPVNMAD